MAYFRGDVFHLGRVNMHQKNSNHVGSYHVEGFQDYFLYKEDRYAKTIDTSDESPCTKIGKKVGLFVKLQPGRARKRIIAT